MSGEEQRSAEVGDHDIQSYEGWWLRTGSTCKKVRSGRWGE